MLADRNKNFTIDLLKFACIRTRSHLLLHHRQAIPPRQTKRIEGEKMVKYVVGDLSNGVFFSGTKEEAEYMYQEALADGFFNEADCEQERRDNGYAPRDEDQISEEVEAFFFIREYDEEYDDERWS